MTIRSILGLLLAGMAAACDGAIHVRGRVYARAASDTAAPSVALVDRTGIDTTMLTPLAGATVIVFQRVQDTAATNTDSLLWTRRGTTGPDGSFNLYDVGAPNAYTAALRVSREGYRTVTVTFPHRDSRQIHRAVAALTPRPR